MRIPEEFYPKSRCAYCDAIVDCMSCGDICDACDEEMRNYDFFAEEAILDACDYAAALDALRDIREFGL